MDKRIVAILFTLMLALMPYSGTIKSDGEELLDLSPKFSDTTPIGWFDECSSTGMSADKCRTIESVGIDHNYKLQSIIENFEPSHNPFAAPSFEDAISIWLDIHPSLDEENEVAFEMLKLWYDMGYSQDEPEYFSKDIMNLVINWITMSNNTEALDSLVELSSMLPNLWNAVQSDKNSSMTDLDMGAELDAAVSHDNFTNLSSITQEVIMMGHTVYSHSFAFWSANTTAVLLPSTLGAEITTARACVVCWVSTADTVGAVGGALVGAFAGFGFGAVPGAEGGALLASGVTGVVLETSTPPPPPPTYNPEEKYNHFAHGFDNMHDNIYDEIIENFACRQGGSVWLQDNVEAATKCMEGAAAYILTSEHALPGPATKVSVLHDQLTDQLEGTLISWYSSGYHSSTAENFTLAFGQFLSETKYLNSTDQMSAYVECLWDNDFADLCASDFNNLTGEDKISASAARAILGQDGETSGRIGPGKMDALGGLLGGGAGLLLGGVGAVILGPATASFYSWSAHYLERVNGLTPPGGGTGIDCDLAADKEKCYDMREMVYAHDLILDELTQIWPPETDDFTWEDATQVLEAAYHIQETEFAYRRCAANLDNGAPDASRGADNLTLDASISAEASARSGPDWPWGSWPPGCPGPYNPTPIDDKFPFLTFGGLNDEIGMCKEGKDTTGRSADDFIPFWSLMIFIEWIINWVPGEDGFGLSGSGTGFGTMTTEEIRVELSKDWSDGNDEQMQLARMQFTRSSNSDLFAMDSDADEQQLRAIGGMVDALVLYQTHDPAMAAGFSRIVDLVVRSSTNGYSPNMTVETPLKSCPIDFIENIDLENDEALLRYEIVDVKVEESNNSTVTDDTTVSDDDNDEGFLPGFGFLSTLVSLVGVAILLQRKQREDND
ncbi:hypothetical protein N9E21_00215 [Candidatus Poseidoniaceae archaeon]|nr:hypothetical protein [Candidatus Poseidoniaceae archaeon]